MSAELPFGLSGEPFRLLVARLTETGPISEGPFTDLDKATERAKKLKAEFPSQEIVFAIVGGHVIENPEKFIVEGTT